MGRSRHLASCSPFSDCSCPMDPPTWIYFVRDGDFIKIGSADGTLRSHVDSRVSALQTGNPRKLTLIGAFRGTWAAERDLHKRFKEDRVRREWFRASPDLLQEIADLLSTDGAFRGVDQG